MTRRVRVHGGADACDCNEFVQLFSRVSASGPPASFVLGVGSLWDFAGYLNPRVLVRSREMSDAEALAGDWERVGHAMWQAFPDIEVVQKEEAPIP